jgi:hypothetical protein
VYNLLKRNKEIDSKTQVTSGKDQLLLLTRYLCCKFYSKVVEYSLPQKKKTRKGLDVSGKISNDLVC